MNYVQAKLLHLLWPLLHIVSINTTLLLLASVVQTTQLSMQWTGTNMKDFLTLLATEHIHCIHSNINNGPGEIYEKQNKKELGKKEGKDPWWSISQTLLALSVGQVLGEIKTLLRHFKLKVQHGDGNTHPGQTPIVKNTTTWSQTMLQPGHKQCHNPVTNTATTLPNVMANV